MLNICYSLCWMPTPVLLPGKSHGWRSLEGCSPRGHWGSDTTERLHFHFSLSCIGEGNGNPLQCSCLENPRDGGAWLAAVYGVAQSRTRLKWLSSSRSSILALKPRKTGKTNGEAVSRAIPKPQALLPPPPQLQRPRNTPGLSWTSGGLRGGSGFASLSLNQVLLWAAIL